MGKVKSGNERSRLLWSQRLRSREQLLCTSVLSTTPDPYGAAANVNIISSRRLSDLGTLASSQRYHTPKATGKRVLSCICYMRYMRYMTSNFGSAWTLDVVVAVRCSRMRPLLGLGPLRLATRALRALRLGSPPTPVLRAQATPCSAQCSETFPQPVVRL